MLQWLIDHLRMAKRVDAIMVATSTEKDDDAIAAFCAGAGVHCFRGALLDVAGRLAAAANSVAAEEFVRISGDSPLMAPGVVDEVIALYESNEVDLATNVQKRTFPKGLSVETIRVAALERARKMMIANEAEHVTQVFYRCPQDFRIVNLESGHDWGSIQMSVDTPADFTLMEKVIGAAAPTWVLSVAELVALRERSVAELSA